MLHREEVRASPPKHCIIRLAFATYDARTELRVVSICLLCHLERSPHQFPVGHATALNRLCEHSWKNVPQIHCLEDARDVDLILMECNSEFDDINFYFGGDDFALTVSATVAVGAHIAARVWSDFSASMAPATKE